MRTTAEYLLLKTSRTSLKPKEVRAFIELSQNHTTARVQKEIETCVERFQQNGKRLSNLDAGYIAACLRLPVCVTRIAVPLLVRAPLLERTTRSKTKKLKIQYLLTLPCSSLFQSDIYLWGKLRVLFRVISPQIRTQTASQPR